MLVIIRFRMVVRRRFVVGLLRVNWNVVRLLVMMLSTVIRVRLLLFGLIMIWAFGRGLVLLRCSLTECLGCLVIFGLVVEGWVYCGY